jgi:hypothetical protein
MAHYAKVLNNKVVEVIVAEADFFDSFIDSTPGTWLSTSFNTRHNEHTNSGTVLRGNFAGIGYNYDSVNDVFYPPQDYPSWVLNETIWDWEAPTAYPDDGKVYEWNEDTTAWVEVT